jgi:long-chain acyl-CoA synthetase
VVVDLCVDFRQFYRDLQFMNSEIVACPPMAIKMFVSDLKRARREKWGTGLKFVFSGAAALPAEAQRTIAENGYFVAFGYGMTELAGPSAINVYMQKFESVGKAAPRTEIEIRDKEIFIKNDSVMLGYYKNPEKTAEVLKDGWIATGDLGYVDEEGFLFLTGRKKNLIILSSGENISPEELEDKLYSNEKIRECKVYARDEKIAVDIYAPGATEEEIRGFVGEINSKMPMFKAITVIELKDSELPKTSTGKIKR